MVDVDDKRVGDGMDEAGRALGRLTELARHELPPAAPEGAAQAAYARFRRAAAADAPGAAYAPRFGRGPLGLFVVGAGACAVVAVVGGMWLAGRLRPPPLALSVEGGAVVEEGGYVRASAESEPSLRFSDGTEVKLARSSRVRVAETRAEGARVLLEEGRARAHVVPRKQSRWVFDAGPCRVQVTGTRFEMRWSGAEQVLDVLLYSGSVVVKGPPASAGVPVHAGQHLTMDVRKGSVRLVDLDPAAEVEGPSASSSSGLSSPFSMAGPTPAAEGPPSPVDPAAKALPTAAPASGLSWSGHTGAAARRGGGGGAESWAARVLAGDFRGVIAEAERRGIDDVLAGDPAGNVMALADAARYAGSPQLARRALLRARARFGGGAPARRAAFLLGRMAEDQDGDLGEALDWYRIYLRDARDDGFRAEALGRQMAATMHLRGVAAARPLAGDYLRRHPRGAYAEAARAILTP